MLPNKGVKRNAAAAEQAQESAAVEIKSAAAGDVGANSGVAAAVVMTGDKQSQPSAAKKAKLERKAAKKAAESDERFELVTPTDPSIPPLLEFYGARSGYKA